MSLCEGIIQCHESVEASNVSFFFWQNAPFINHAEYHSAAFQRAIIFDTTQPYVLNIKRISIYKM